MSKHKDAPRRRDRDAAGKALKQSAAPSKTDVKRMAGRILDDAAISRRSRLVIERTATKYARALKRLADK